MRKPMIDLHSPLPRPDASPSRRAAQPVVIVGAGLLQEGEDGRLAVVGVGPRPRLEAAGLIAERNLGENAVAQVNAVGLVLGGGQQELAQREIPRIDVHRPRLGIRPGLHQLAFQGVGVPLDFGQPIRCYQVAEGEKLLAQVGPHRGGVVVGLVEGEGRTFAFDRAIRFFQARPRQGEGVGVAAEDGRDEEHGDGGTRFGHAGK